MSGTFQTGASSIDLSGPPWNTTAVIRIYVQNTSGQFSVYTDPQGMMLLDPPEISSARKTSTGIYVFMTNGSDSGTKFTDGLESRPLPVTWMKGSPPASITYGKVRSDRLAFSMKNEWDHDDTQRYEFDIHLELPDGTISRLNLGADPVILEAGELPPDGLI